MMQIKEIFPEKDFKFLQRQKGTEMVSIDHQNKYFIKSVIY